MTVVLYLPWLHPEGVDDRLVFVGSILVGALCYGSFCYGFARRELRAFLAEYVAHRP